MADTCTFGYGSRENIIAYRKASFTKLLNMCIDAQLELFKMFEEYIENPEVQYNENIYKNLLKVTNCLYALMNWDWSQIKYAVMRRGAEKYIQQWNINWMGLKTNKEWKGANLRDILLEFNQKQQVRMIAGRGEK